MTTSSKKRFVVFTTDAGQLVGVNPDHVCLVEPRTRGATIFLVAPGENDKGAYRHVRESFDEVLRSLRDEERPRVV
jgi:hypothetical protein